MQTVNDATYCRKVCNDGKTQDEALHGQLHIAIVEVWRLDVFKLAVIMKVHFRCTLNISTLVILEASMTQVEFIANAAFVPHSYDRSTST